MSPGFTDFEIEEATISAMMQWESSVTGAQSHGLTADHFISPHCRVLFEHVTEEWKEQKVCDLVLLTERLRLASQLELAGGIAKVTEIWAQTCHSPKAMPFYIEIIQERYAKRKVVETCDDALKSAEPEGSALKHDTIERLTAIPDPAALRPRKTFAQMVAEKIQRMQTGEQDSDLVSTGLIDLDQKSPLRLGDMPLIAGERKSGKTVLALSILLNVARQGGAGLYFSLEDPEPKVTDRLFAQVSRIPLNAPRRGGAVSPAFDTLAKLPISVRDDLYDLSAIVGATRDEHARRPFRIVIVDYGQLVRTKASRDRRELEVAEVSRSLRLLAMELRVPVIVLSQLNAEGQTRESRALEQDCTAMWMVKHVKGQSGKRLIDIPFQRNGESGVSFEVAFLGEIARVESLGDDL